MELEILNGIEDDLVKKKEELIKLNSQASEKAWILGEYNNTFFKFAYSTLTYAGIIIALLVLRGVLQMAGITLNIPRQLVFPSVLLPSLIVGTHMQNKYEKKNSLKERLSKFSKTTTKEEQLEEEIQYTIEEKQCMDKIAVIDGALNDIKNKKEFISDNSNIYSLSINNNANREELERNISDSSSLLESKFHEIDTLSAHNLLCKEFANEREFRKYSLTTFGLGGGTALFMYVNLPYTVLGLGTQFSGIFGLVEVFGIYLASISIISFYQYKKMNERTRVFNKINQKLGDDALRDDASISSASENIAKKEKLICEASKILVSLEQQKRLLQSINERVEDSNVGEKQYTIEPTYVVNDDKQFSTQDSSIPVEEEYPSEMYIDGEIDQGKSLVKKNNHRK